MSTMTITRPAAVHADSLLEPTWAEIVEITPEVEGVSTFWFKFVDPDLQSSFSFRPGQFNMVYVPGVGEAAISISSDPEDKAKIGHSIRFVGNVTRAVSRLKVGDVVGLRGPFGSAWPLDDIEGKDIVLAAGGIGLPPLRPVIYRILHNREKYGKVTIVYGARTPSELMYRDEYDSWKQAGIDLQLTVDRADAEWTGRVGVVPMWFYGFRVDARRTAVLTCGPEIMIRFVIYEALARRIPPESIHVSLERNMKCGQGSCGHCQVGPYFICKDGPVFRFDALQPYFNVEEF
ncbi:MAG TPA: FAD/NAD(P)-binding protein [Anaerolineales bacterium]|nr:FAD/NAD(P)-binding protein [Anaerolineales bacterium]